MSVILRGNNKNSRKSNQSQDTDYDLKRSFSKISSYTRKSKRDTYSEFTKSERTTHPNDSVLQSRDSMPNQTSSLYWQNRYDRLEDKMSDFHSKNENQHSQLRLELEGKIGSTQSDFNSQVKILNEKIDKKLSIQWYIWTIVGLCAIASIWYMLSYSVLISDVSTMKDDIHQLDKKIDRIDSQSFINDSTNYHNQRNKKDCGASYR